MPVVGGVNWQSVSAPGLGWIERVPLRAWADETTVFVVMTPSQPVHGLRLRVHLHPDPAGRLVDEIDGLVGQLTIGDITL